jgi:secreted trypsin-like serine protease
VFPDRFSDFQRRAMQAIARHAKYSGSTAADGTASLSGVEPDSYYLFAITRVGRGFAMWDASITVSPGENVLNLSPQPITEIPDTMSSSGRYVP